MTAVRSKMAGSRSPHSRCRQLCRAKPGLASADLATGQPRLVNVFASWCVPVHRRSAAARGAAAPRAWPSTPLRVRDRPEDVAAFLARHGDPFDAHWRRPESRVQLALGSSGVPESFIVDGRGIIRYPAYGPDRAATTCRRSCANGRRRSEALAIRIAFCCIGRPRAGRQRLAAGALGQPRSCPMRARKPRPRR